MNSRALIGVILVVLGGFLFLNKGTDFGTGNLIALLWPSMFVIPLGVFFHWMYFGMLNRKGIGLLVPGGILLTSGVVMQIATLFDGWEYLWPGFIFAVAVGLFELYFFGSKPRGLLIPITILTVISLIFFTVFSIGAMLSSFSNQPVLAIILIAAGAVLMVGWKKRAV